MIRTMGSMELRRVVRPITRLLLADKLWTLCAGLTEELLGERLD